MQTPSLTRSPHKLHQHHPLSKGIQQTHTPTPTTIPATHAYHQHTRAQHTHNYTLNTHKQAHTGHTHTLMMIYHSHTQAQHTHKHASLLERSWMESRGLAQGFLRSPRLVAAPSQPSLTRHTPGLVHHSPQCGVKPCPRSLPDLWSSLSVTRAGWRGRPGGHMRGVGQNTSCSEVFWEEAALGEKQHHKDLDCTGACSLVPTVLTRPPFTECTRDACGGVIPSFMQSVFPECLL